MNPDPDLRPLPPQSPQQAGPRLGFGAIRQQFQDLPSQNYGNMVNTPTFSAYERQPAGPAVKPLMILMTILTLFSVIFLLFTAVYSFGLLPGTDPETDGTSRWAVFIMAFISGLVGCVTSYVALRQAEKLGSFVFDRVNKGLFLTIIVLVILISIAPFVS